MIHRALLLSARITDKTVQCSQHAAPLELPPPAGGGPFEFDAVVLEEDLSIGNQRIAGYELQACSMSGGCTESQWTTITGEGAEPRQPVVLGVTVGRRVIERGFNGTNGLTVRPAGLRFRCTAAFPAGTTTAHLRSFSAHKMKPPPGWPKPAPKPFDCELFGCTCKGMADFYGVRTAPRGFGCAPTAAQVIRAI